MVCLMILFSRKHVKYLLMLIVVEVGISAQLWFGHVCLNVLIKFYKAMVSFKK